MAVRTFPIAFLPENESDCNSRKGVHHGTLLKSLNSIPARTIRHLILIFCLGCYMGKNNGPRGSARFVIRLTKEKPFNLSLHASIVTLQLFRFVY